MTSKETNNEDKKTQRVIKKNEKNEKECEHLY